MVSTRQTSQGADGRSRKRPTINDIARLANVSKKTVSRVINNSPFVRGDTREQIQAVIREHGYVPDPQARGLSFRREFLVGLLFADDDADEIVEVQRGLTKALSLAGVELVVWPCGMEKGDLAQTVRGFAERRRLRGLVLMPSVGREVHLAALDAWADCLVLRLSPTETAGGGARRAGERAGQILTGTSA